ncbi:MAG: hypothetical protein J0J00_10695, partial [Microbacterium sp.]|nr:hypothetical protein [Microbacterium sp.]
MSTAVAATDRDTPGDAAPPPPAPEPDARAHARREAAALREIKAPVAGVIRVACILAAVGAACALVPFAGLAALGELLLAPGPLDTGRVVLVAWLVVAGLGARG